MTETTTPPRPVITQNMQDKAAMIIAKRLEEAEKVWAEQNHIQPPYPLQTHVSLKSAVLGPETGVITGIYEYGAARYEIAIDGDPEAVTGTRRIVKFEDVTPVTDEVAA